MRDYAKAKTIYLNKEWHSEVHDVMSPCEFDDDIGFHQVVALKIKIENLYFSYKTAAPNNLSVRRGSTAAPTNYQNAALSFST